MRTVNIIAAVAPNAVIGKDGKLPWHYPEDLNYFKSVTKGSTVIMGRNTWESLPGLLPDRENVVVSSTMAGHCHGPIIRGSLYEAVCFAKTPQIFIIGGAKLYEQALEFADFMLMTKLNKNYDGDTYFPDWPDSEWDLVASQNWEHGVFTCYKRANHDDVRSI